MNKLTGNQPLFYKAATLALVLINLWFIVSGFGRFGTEKFDQIDANRINIMGSNGKPAMVIAGKSLLPGPAMNGKTYPPEYSDGRQLFSGIIFFNENGDEVGGLIYNGFKKDSGYYAMEHLSFDQWKQNQVVALQYLDNGRTKRSGLRIYDRPNVPLDEIFDRFKARNSVPRNSPAWDSISKEIKASADRGDNGLERMFIGSLDEQAQIQMRDKKGTIRLKMFVDNDGAAKIQFMDEKGNVVKTVTQSDMK